MVALKTNRAGRPSSLQTSSASDTTKSRKALPGPVCCLQKQEVVEVMKLIELLGSWHIPFHRIPVFYANIIRLHVPKTRHVSSYVEQAGYDLDTVRPTMHPSLTVNPMQQINATKGHHNLLAASADEVYHGGPCAAMFVCLALPRVQSHRSKSWAHVFHSSRLSAMC